MKLTPVHDRLFRLARLVLTLWLLHQLLTKKDLDLQERYELSAAIAGLWSMEDTKPNLKIRRTPDSTEQPK